MKFMRKRGKRWSRATMRGEYGLSARCFDALTAEHAAARSALLAVEAGPQAVLGAAKRWVAPTVVGYRG